MPRRCRHQNADEVQRPCSCEMGNIYRFTEPIVLLAIAKLGEAHGYQIAQEAEQLAVTHAGLDAGAVYRALRRLEENGHAASHWETSGEGPARRVYMLTTSGLQHLNEWIDVLESLTRSLYDLTSHCRKAAAMATPKVASDSQNALV
jgi:PadR family transcriptional regulator, regulatory protein PadR